MTKHRLQTLLKLKKANRHIPCRISQNNLRATCNDKIERVSHIYKEIMFETDSSGRWTFLSPMWHELTGFTVAQSIGSSFLDYVHPHDYLYNLELFEIFKAQHIQESTYKTRYKTLYGNACAVKIRMQTLLDNQGQMIGTSGKLEFIDFGNQPEYYTNEQNQINSQDDVKVIRANNQAYLEALISVETVLQTFDGSNQCYAEILSILRLAYNPSRIYICEIHQSKDDLLINQKAELYDRAIVSQTDKMPLQNKQLAEIFPNFSQRLVRGDIAWSNLTEVSLEEQRFFEARGIFSILLLPFIVNGEFFGFIGLENCLEGRVWQSTEITFLRATVLAISLAYKNLITKKYLHKTIKQIEL